MHDLRGREDLEALLREFYRRAFEDPLLRHVFVDVVHMDLEEHLPAIVGFWEKVLFDVGTYDGRVMEVHRRVHHRIALTPEHFTRWLALWHACLQDLYQGPVADQADAHARRMAGVFLRQLTDPSARTRRTLPVVARR
jgi:hemoglobin